LGYEKYNDNKNQKLQKVKFHRGDKRPNNLQPPLSYIKKMVKRGKEIIWQVIEEPTKNVVAEYFFEEDAQIQSLGR
jgi:hypothetical protein